MDNLKSKLKNKMGRDLLERLFYLKNDISWDMMVTSHQGPWFFTKDHERILEDNLSLLEEYKSLSQAEIRLVNSDRTKIYKVISAMHEYMDTAEDKDESYEIYTLQEKIKVWVYHSLLGLPTDTLELIKEIRQYSDIFKHDELKEMKFTTGPIRLNVLDLTDRDNSSFIRGLVKAGFLEINLIHTKEGSDYKYMKSIENKFSCIRVGHVPVQPMYEDLSLDWEDKWIDEKVALGTKNTAVIANKQEDINPYLKYLNKKSFCIRLPNSTKANDKEIQKMPIKISV